MTLSKELFFLQSLWQSTKYVVKDKLDKFMNGLNQNVPEMTREVLVELYKKLYTSFTHVREALDPAINYLDSIF